MINEDRKTIRTLLDKQLNRGKINHKKHDELFNTLALKAVTVGTGYNDLGIIEKGNLNKVKKEELTSPRGKDFKNLASPWIDSGIRENANEVGQMEGNDGSQLILARAKDEKGNLIHINPVNNADRSPEIEDLGVKYLYKDDREVIHAKGNNINKNILSNIRRIERIAYREKQQMLDGVNNIKELANRYELNAEDIQVKISSKNDWYVIYTEDDKELYIGDLAMLNGANSEKNEKVKTDAFATTTQMMQTLYEMMLESAEKGKKVRFEATEDTSYKNVEDLVKRGILKVEEENVEEWGSKNFDDDYYDEDEEEYYDEQQEIEQQDKPIMMHNIVASVDKEKLKRALETIKKRNAREEETNHKVDRLLDDSQR